MTAIIVTIEGVRTRASTAEALVTLAVPLESADMLSAFLGKVGKQVAVAFADIENPKPAAASSNEIARALMACGYFRNVALWAAVEAEGIYTQEEHKQIVMLSPCLYQQRHTLPCNGDVVLHHVRTSANSGTGIKPPHWYGIPLCHTHHDHVHRKNTREDLDQQLKAAVQLTADQMKVKLKAWLGIKSLAEITAQQKAHLDALWKP